MSMRLSFVTGRLMACWGVFSLIATAVAGEPSLAIKGSNTFGHDLAPVLIREFRQAHPEIGVTLESKGSGSGFAALLAGDCAIASSSRPANEDELRLARSRGVALADHPIGYYGVAVIVNAGNPVARLSDDQVRDVFTGAATDWRMIGGSPGAVHLYILSPGLGESLGFQELAMERRPYAASARACSSYVDVVAAVAKDPGGHRLRRHDSRQPVRRADGADKRSSPQCRHRQLGRLSVLEDAAALHRQGPGIAGRAGVHQLCEVGRGTGRAQPDGFCPAGGIAPALDGLVSCSM